MLGEDEGIVLGLHIEAGQILLDRSLKQVANMLSAPKGRAGDADPFVELAEGIMHLGAPNDEAGLSEESEQVAELEKTFVAAVSESLESVVVAGPDVLLGRHDVFYRDCSSAYADPDHFAYAGGWLRQVVDGGCGCDDIEGVVRIWQLGRLCLDECDVCEASAFCFLLGGSEQLRAPIQGCDV